MHGSLERNITRAQFGINCSTDPKNMIFKQKDKLTGRRRYKIALACDCSWTHLISLIHQQDFYHCQEGVSLLAKHSSKLSQQ